jgi:hypothetical protein
MRVGQVEEVGDRRVLIEDVKSSGLAKRSAIPETAALYQKRQRTLNNITCIKYKKKKYLKQTS